MDNYQSIFKRYEKKYLLTQEQYDALMERIGELAAPDAYGETTVMNLYYDTPDYRIIRRSLEKPVYKEKLRIRSYGVPEGGTQVFLELKKKFKKVVYKRRIALPYREAVGHLEEGMPLQEVSQIGTEVNYFLKMYPDLTRGMVIIYERTAYAGIKDPDLRITFDRNIRYRERGPGCDLTTGDEGREILAEGERIMEIKVPLAMPLELVHLLNELKIYPHSFSKYGQAYLHRFGKSKVQRTQTVKAAAQPVNLVKKGSAPVSARPETQEKAAELEKRIKSAAALLRKEPGNEVKDE